MNSFTDTTLQRKRSLQPMLLALTLATSATAENTHKFPYTWNQRADAATSVADLLSLSNWSQHPVASTSKRGMNFRESVNFFDALLSKNELAPSRKSVTGDESELFEFLGKNKACVDIYPSGVVAVIIRKAEIDEFYELDISDANFIISLLKDAGVSI